MIEASLIRQLELKAWQIRREIVIMFGHGKFHHFGGALSCADIWAALYF